MSAACQLAKGKTLHTILVLPHPGITRSLRRRGLVEAITFLQAFFENNVGRESGES